MDTNAPLYSPNLLINTTLNYSGCPMFENGTCLDMDNGLPLWARNVELCYLFLIGTLAFPGNTLIIIVELKNKDKVSVDYLVLTMAIFELICSTFNVYAQMIAKISSIWSLIASTAVCKLFVFTGYLTTMSTAFLLTAIAFDRYVKTCRPFCERYNCRVAKYLCVVISMMSVLVSTPSAVTFRLGQRLRCLPSPELEHVMRVSNVFLGFTVIVLLIIIALAYLKITMTLRRRYRMKLKDNIWTVKADSLNIPRKQNLPLNLRINMMQSMKKSKIEPLNISTKPKPGTFLFGPSSSYCKTNMFEKRHFAVKTLTSMSEPSSIVSLKKAKHKYISKDQSKTPPCVGIKRKIELRLAQSQSDGRSGQRRWFVKDSIVNQTTFIMFLITLIYTITYGLSSLMVLSNYSVLGKVMQSWSKTFKMINCVTNPVFFFSISSKFRAKAKSIIWK